MTDTYYSVALAPGGPLFLVRPKEGYLWVWEKKDELLLVGGLKIYKTIKEAENAILVRYNKPIIEIVGPLSNKLNLPKQIAQRNNLEPSRELLIRNPELKP